MNKNGGFLGTLFLILSLVAVGYSAYYLYQNIPRESINLVNTNSQQITTTNTIPSKQFYDNMRYSDRTINYHISESCPENKANRTKEALDTIEAKTVLIFNPVSKPNSVLNILCSDISPEAEEENHFVAGEGGPSRVLNSTLYSVILEGKVALYREGTCNNANVAIHELLHALGFDHNNNRRSILYPTLECDQEIDQEIIDSINELYGVESLPDLTFDKVNATKSGRYLNFHIEVLNRGLISANNAVVGIYADNKFIETFDLNTISIGAKKIIDVGNLKVPLNAENIEFVIDYGEEIAELYENNNKIALMNTI
ncbi:MAG: CARDB domain-containing protein [Nanoarchaeota archaeon]